ncbi:aspartate/tyrosine/aromatic aminotransferase [Brucella pseudogrignonensis]|nr:aminotransferase [Ochrobactrum sp. MYb237]PQZ44477.1 aspartate/tyrosine/aromatic aminotransferase [Brucella pseudogrignonensis]PRA41786.1 aspartate/tyrosine/aromatic aminotransferase [Brucella pseudogrignonensis]PRA70787.1 aspartate/tyrosine/aromatic aminotransferase [Brucella pseudogrignonensis]
MPLPIINPLIDKLSAPPIPAVQAWARQYDGAHGPLIDLSQAVPGYPPHPDMLRFLGEAASSVAYAGYGPIEGETVLREAYARHVGNLYGAEIKANNVHITSGCNQAFIAAIMCVAQSGDTVLATDPFYFNHQSSLEMLGIRSETMLCRAENGFVPDIEDVRAALHKGVRALVLVSPNNPTGAIYPPQLLTQIYAACRDNGTWLLLDETYRDFLSDADQAPHDLFKEVDWPSHLIQLYSFSKSFCIPGHRLGAIVAGADMVANVAKVMDNLQICATRAPQIAVSRAIEPLKSWRDDNRKEIARRAEALRVSMSNVAGWHVEAVGAYFAFVRHPYDGSSSVAVAERLAKTTGIITLPGSFFGESQDAFLRFAFANVDVAGIEATAARLSCFKM